MEEEKEVEKREEKTTEDTKSKVYKRNKKEMLIHSCSLVSERLWVKPQAITVFLDCLHTKIKSSTLLAKPYTQEAKHQPIFAQL